ncbi:hypothetical protein A2333_02230 [Candidatus Wolfebacteria bacterium RIFOXYB2_FULL_49_7]|uniref:Uncharacterized protein n=1 Tax=Candidatus Wolfebacteria bacterium RIFOXYB1_FULL_54_12 TaxID=1802559 RepID=A0A1F8DVY9_9BACT|nr:MAG: hypothetical protein A2372_00490 [Candidatus Wolfebacteria bacterium RIFOXYB1_FULL_54_12]OGM94168.1 MAG: hypothetical protein A2333_02230 [Candidatus Wolfebacteria bacterium RIFOXYB2_FULL_49_7]
MLTVTNEQIYDRWEYVPESLKEAFFSPEKGDIIWKACEEAGLSDEIAEQVLIVAGNVMLGFTQFNDLANELRTIPGMNPQAVDRAIFQMDKRIFAPIKGDILKLYGDMLGTGPRIVAESGSEIVKKESIAMESAPAMMVAEAPVPATDTGNAEVDIRKVRIGEAPVAEAPAMIHSEVELQPVAQKRRALSSFGGMFGFGKAQGQKKEGATVAAEVSMVDGVGVRPQEMAEEEQQRPVRVVHYTSAKAPEDIFGTSAQEQKDAAAFAPVAKQDHEVDFEPKVIDLTSGGQAVAATREQGVQPMPDDVAPELSPTVPVLPMPEMPPVVVMKTPQRMESIAPSQQGREPRLADIPVSDNVIDLRALERATDNLKPITDNNSVR